MNCKSWYNKKKENVLRKLIRNLKIKDKFKNLIILNTLRHKNKVRCSYNSDTELNLFFISRNFYWGKAFDEIWSFKGYTSDSGLHLEERGAAEISEVLDIFFPCCPPLNLKIPYPCAMFHGTDNKTDKKATWIIVTATL